MTSLIYVEIESDSANVLGASANRVGARSSASRGRARAHAGRAGGSVGVRGRGGHRGGRLIDVRAVLLAHAAAAQSD